MRKGSHQTEEAKLKISKRMSEIRKEYNPMKGRTGELHPNFGKPMSKEQKQKISESKKGQPSPFKEKHHTEEAKRKNSEAHKGKVAWNKGLKNSNSIAVGVGGNGCWYEKSNDNKVWLRSENELRVAIKLDELNILWEYEPKAFDLGDTYYHPDFLILNQFWWEVKGKYSSSGKKKVLKFKELYPTENIKIIYKTDIELLEQLINDNYNDIEQLGEKI